MLYAYQDGAHTHLRQDGEAQKLRLVLVPSQFELLSDSYTKGKQIEVCSSGSFAHCNSVEQVMDRMSQVRLPPHNGGWRPLSNEETYALYLAKVDAVAQLAGGHLLPTTHQALAQHPLIKSGISFAYNGEITLSLIQLMQEIYDILRFCSPEHLDGRSRLKSYFRLHRPETIMKLLIGATPTSVGQVRAVLATHGWRQQPFQTAPRDEIEANPKAFLFRYFFASRDRLRKDNPEERAHGLALWRTTVKYILFVRQLWLNGLGVEPFDPSKFFDRDDEVESFNDYIKPVDFKA
jgi:hypothetical protein